MSNYTDSCQLVPFLNNLLVMKMVTVSDLCLCYIIYIDLFIRAFGSQTTFNDPCPVQFYMIFDQNNGRVVNSPLSFVLLAFFKDIPNGRMGWS